MTCGLSWAVRLAAHGRGLGLGLRWLECAFTHFKQGRLAWLDKDGGPVAVDADVAKVVFPADFWSLGVFLARLFAARLGVDQQYLAFKLLGQQADLLAGAGEAILLAAEIGQ